MSSRGFKTMKFSRIRANGGRRYASRQRMYAAARAKYSYVPRTPGALVTTERKYFDTFLNGASLTAPVTWAGAELDPATLNCLFVPNEGSDIDNRVGRKVSVLKIQVRGQIFVPFQQNATAADNPAQTRLIVYQDEQTNGAQAQAEQLMQDPGAADASLCLNTFQNTQNFGRFRVLKDKMYTIQNPNMSYDGTNIEINGISRPFKFTVRFKKPVVVRFNATNGGSVADIVDNSFHMIGMCLSTALAPTISYQVRTVYVDA